MLLVLRMYPGKQRNHHINELRHTRNAGQIWQHRSPWPQAIAQQQAHPGQRGQVCNSSSAFMPSALFPILHRAMRLRGPPSSPFTFAARPTHAKERMTNMALQPCEASLGTTERSIPWPKEVSCCVLSSSLKVCLGRV